MKNKTVIFSIGLFLLTGITFGIYKISSYNQSAKESIKTEYDKDGKIELTFTQEELKELGKWKNASIDQLADDALHGDRAGLYLIGIFHLYGQKGCPLDIKKATAYFTSSGSLGFAPALDKLRGGYLDQHMICKDLIYMNLVITHGHLEYIDSYYNSRTLLTRDGFTPIAEEIERLASTKTIAIEKNIENLQKLIIKDDKLLFVTRLMSQGIAEEDINFDEDYWLSFL